MLMRLQRTTAIMVLLGAGCGLFSWLRAQEPEGAAPTAADSPPPVPKGVEVMARGPVHEAFAAPTAEAAPTKGVPKQPPKPINEVPPDEKPEGDVTWIGGYWAWDDDRNDFLWVSGVWRVVPPGKQWVAGYWREEGDQWQWVNGFWTDAAPPQAEASKDVTYLPAPPKPPDVASPGDPPSPDTFYVPGTWVWSGDAYAWRAGYWARVQPGYVWVPAHYRWTPGGYLYIAGYWDLALPRRGFLYAPVVVDYAVVGPTFVYTPAYAVRDTVVLDAMFVRPCYGCYYFGDYYGPRYREIGFESCVVYSRRHYDAIIVYERYERRRDPAWINIQIDLCSRRDRGLAACPPRTLVQQNTIIQQNIIQQNNVTINNNTTNVVNNTTNRTVNNNTVNKNVVNNNTVLMPTSRLAAEKKVQTVKLDSTTRNQALANSRAVQQVAMQRSRTETASPGIPTRPRQASLSVPPVQPVRTPAEARSAQQRQAANPPARTVNPAVRNPNPTAPTGTNPGRNVAPPSRTAPPSRPAYTPPRTANPIVPRTPAPNTAPYQRYQPPATRPGAASYHPAGQPPRTMPPANRPAPAYRPAPPNRQPPPNRPQNDPRKKPPG